MINKKYFNIPEEAGLKDAIHIPVVSAVAAEPLSAGRRVSINQYNLAIGDSDGKFIVHPFNGDVYIGQLVWLWCNPNEISEVKHVWDCDQSFIPTKEPKRNEYLNDIATRLGIDYVRFMKDCRSVVETGSQVTYYGDANILNEIIKESLYHSEFWSEWQDESGYEFKNMGTDCCPEYDYPERFPYRKMPKPKVISNET